MFLTQQQHHAKTSEQPFLLQHNKHNFGIEIVVTSVVTLPAPHICLWLMVQLKGTRQLFLGYSFVETGGKHLGLFRIKGYATAVLLNHHC